MTANRRRAIDPVCGMTIDPARAAGEVGLQGPDAYYFCNHPASRDSGGSRIVPEPRARSQCDAAGQPRAPNGTRYVCPMDPEIEQDHPGACPKCGMALEPDLSTIAADARRIHVPHAPRNRPDAARRLPDLRHGARAADRGARGSAQPRTRRHDAAAVDRAVLSVCRCSSLAMGDMLLGMGLGGRVGHARDELDRSRLRDAGGAVGRVAVLRARLGTRSSTATPTCSR